MVDVLLRQRRGAFKYVQGIMTHIVALHGLGQHIYSNRSIVQAFLNQAKKQILLGHIRILLILAHKGVLTK